MSTRKIQRLKQRLAKQNSNLNLMMELALEFEKLGNYYRAGRYLKKVLGRNPDNMQAMRLLQTIETHLLIRKYSGYKSFDKWYDILASGRAGDHTATDQLIKGLHDRHKWIRKECIYALGEIANDNALEALVGAADQPDLEFYVGQALNKVCEKKSPACILKKVKSMNKQICINIIMYLGFRKDANAADALIGIARDRNEDKWIRGSASWALGVIGDRKALDTLKNIIRDEPEEYVREESEEACRKIISRLGTIQNARNN